MLAGHVGAALALHRVERRINVGTLVLAAFLLDVLLWVFILCGVEHVTIPADYAQHHYLRFTFPYSHGLLASIMWSALVGGLTWLITPQFGSARRRATLVLGAAVCSHWLLDALVHVPELPLTGAHSPHVGLALWDHMPLALTLETGITAVGLALYGWGRPHHLRTHMGMVVLTVLLTIFTIVGMTVAPAPTDTHQVAVVSLVANLVIVAVAWWLGSSSIRIPRA